MNIGARLREERERLAMSQEKFGALGGVQKRAQINYEAGERQPDAAYLAAIADAGADVLYILTGNRKYPLPAVLPPRVQALVANYQAAPEEGKRHIEGAASLASQAAKKGKAA